MKLKFLMPSFRGGGAERVFIDLATSFHRKGYDVQLVVVSDEGEYKKQIISSLPLNILNRSRVLFSLIDLMKLSIKSQDDTVIISCLTHLNLLAAIAWLFTGQKGKLIVTEHNNYSSEKKDIRGFKRKILDFLTRFTYSKSSGVVAVSNGVKQDLSQAIRLNNSHITVIHNPIDIEKIQLLSRQNGSKLDIANSEEYKIYAMGRLVYQKRYDILIRAFSIVLKELPKAKLIIMGDGVLENELINLSSKLNISKNINFRPFQENPFKELINADVFVLSSDFEGFGNVIVEALALNLQVVSTNSPSGPSEILDNGKYGCLVECGNPSNLALAILNTVQNKPYSGLIERSKDFHIDVAVKNYQKLFEDILA